jgi:hypothetical protein
MSKPKKKRLRIRDLAFCGSCEAFPAHFDEEGLCASCGATVAGVAAMLRAVVRTVVNEERKR